MKLKTRREPYWVKIHQGLAVGYRKGARGGFWIGRLYDDTNGRRYRSLGVADDNADAETGGTVLSFGDAQAAARTYETEQARIDKGLDPKTGWSEGEALADYTVAKAIADYLTDNSDKGDAFKESGYRINADILPTLGDVEILKLTARRITDWHRELAQRAARKRGRKGDEAKFKDLPQVCR